MRNGVNKTDQPELVIPINTLDIVIYKICLSKFILKFDKKSF